MSAPFKSHITREEINALPLKKYAGPIRLLSTSEQVSAALPDILKETILGFDTETRACFRKGESYPVSLVQLAGAQVVYLIQLGRLSNLDWFDVLFAKAKWLKVGVGLDYDVRKLRELRPFEPAGFLELSKLADRAGIQNNGLRGLAAVVLAHRITKGAQRSDWSRPTLAPAQIAYAATDAWVSREIYLQLSRHAPGEGGEAGKSAGAAKPAAEPGGRGREG